MNTKRSYQGGSQFAVLFLILSLILTLGSMGSPTLAASDEPPFTGVPVTEFQIQIADTLSQRHAAGQPIPDVTFITQSAGVQPSGMLSSLGEQALENETSAFEAQTILYFDGPQEAGYSEWPAVEINGYLAGEGNTFSTGDITEAARQGVENQVPGFWQNTEYGQEAREYTITETFELSSGSESPLPGLSSFGSIPSILPETLQMGSELSPSTGDILMGFTFTGPHIRYVIEQKVRPCVYIWPFGTICAELFYIKAGFELDWGLGLRLPAEVTLGPGVEAPIETSLDPQNWSVDEYNTYGAAPEPNADDETDGNEFVMRFDFFVGMLIRVAGVEVCPLPRCYVDLSEDFSDSFMTPFGTGTSFPIPPLEIPLFEIDAGLGNATINFEITPHLTSTQITAEWEAAAGDECSENGTVSYEQPGIPVGIDPTNPCFNDTEEPIQVTLEDFRYHFNKFDIGFGAGISYNLAGYSGSYSKEVYSLKIGNIFGGLYLGDYVECDFLFQCFGPGNVMTFPEPFTDNTPPVITPIIEGTRGYNGWYKSNVTLTWVVTDSESLHTTIGCDAQSFYNDQPQTAYSCTAESEGGTAEMTVTIGRDATPPILTCPSGGPFPLNSADQLVGPAEVYDETSGLNEEFSTLTAIVPTASAGTQIVVFSAFDQAGNYASIECDYVVITPPTSVAGGPYEGDEGSAISLDGSGSYDPDEDPLTYSWIVDSPLCSFDDATSATPNLTCADNGNFPVALEVDDGKTTDIDTASVTVINVEPTATFNAPTYVIAGGDFELSLTDPFDPSPVDTAAGFYYAFDCDDGSDYGGEWSSTNTATCSTADDEVANRTVKGKIRDKDGGETEYEAMVIVLPPSAATDSALCYYDRHPEIPGQQFRLIFTPDMQIWPAYKLPASNPGQFFYNVFYTGEGPADFSITIPEPFVTQGAMPVHVYTDVSLVEKDGFTCFAPDLESEIYAGDFSGLSGLSDPSGFLYVTIHLDYGLKGTTGYIPNKNKDALDATDGVTVLIPNLEDYPFSVSGSQSDSQTIQNINDFKKIPGLGGLVMDGFNPVAGATVEIYINGALRGTAITDEDGWYMFAYKHTGKPVPYTVKWQVPGSEKSGTLKANQFVEVNFP